MDIGIILDAQVLSHSNFWPEVTGYVKEIILDNFAIGPNATRIAVMIYGDTPQIQFGFEECNTHEELKTALDLDKPKHPQVSKLDSALAFAAKEMFKDHKRPGSAQVAIIITRWSKMFTRQDVESAVLLQESGVDILAGVVTAGYITHEGEWEMRLHQEHFQIFKSKVAPIISGPVEEYLFEMDPNNKEDTGTKLVKTIYRGCGAAIDIGFILDVAHFRDIDKAKAVVKDIIGHFRIGRQRTRAAMLVYSEVPQVLFHFEDYETAEEVNEAVDQIHDIPQVSLFGKSGTSLALTTALNEIFVGYERPATAQVAILFSMMNTMGDKDIVENGIHLKDAGITILAGTWSPDRSDMAKIASEPLDDHLFDLPPILNSTFVSDKFVRSVCQAPVPS